MKDIIDRYDESKYPALLEILFFMILVIDLILAIWMTFMAPLYIVRMPYLKYLYMAIIPIAYIAPVITSIYIRKNKRHLLLITTIYLVLRVVYLSFTFINEINYRIAEASGSINKEIASSIISSGIFCIAFTLIFSIVWIIAINKSKTVRYHIDN